MISYLHAELVALLAFVLGYLAGGLVMLFLRTHKPRL